MVIGWVIALFIFAVIFVVTMILFSVVPDPPDRWGGRWLIGTVYFFCLAGIALFSLYSGLFLIPRLALIFLAGMWSTLGGLGTISLLFFQRQDRASKVESNRK